MTEKQH